MENKKRLFWGFEVLAPWPEEYPQGRLINNTSRHITVTFLGNVDHLKFLESLPDIPPIPFKIGLVGAFNKCSFFPSARHPNVTAWEIDWWDDPTELFSFQKDFSNWHKSKQLIIHEKEVYLPHTTICRSPKNLEEWKKAFHPLPMMIKDFHLYESLGNLQYKPLFTYPIKPPFEEIEHTADIAFRVRGKDLAQLRTHAFAAIIFKYPDLLSYFIPKKNVLNLDEIIVDLNQMISSADVDIGSPIKAISYHGKVELEEDTNISWEMIIDV